MDAWSRMFRIIYVKYTLQKDSEQTFKMFLIKSNSFVTRRESTRANSVHLGVPSPRSREEQPVSALIHDALIRNSVAEITMST